MQPEERESAAVETDEPESEYEVFDVQAWFEAYMADDEARAEDAAHAGVPFH